jgi:energy-coupling factor transport system ATP-binding protein
MGSNGSGKTTLARCLNGLLGPTGGSVKVEGSDDRRVLHRRVGLVFQDPNQQMTSLTAERELAFGLENIGVQPEEMRARVDAYLRLFQFADRKDQRPSALSGGERQRLAIASVMILEPHFLVLDEATSLLAARPRINILELILKLRLEHNVGVILITQYPAEALQGDRLIVLHQGEVVLDDQPATVFKQSKDLVRLGVAIPTSEKLRMTP